MPYHLLIGQPNQASVSRTTAEIRSLSEAARQVRYGEKTMPLSLKRGKAIRLNQDLVTAE